MPDLYAREIVKYVQQRLTCGWCFFMDISKALAIINHDLLRAKFEAYGLSHSAFSYMLRYLKDRFQRVIVNSIFSTWE